MKIGFIGLGNMARAMIGGMLQKEMVKPEEIIGSAKTRETREKMAAEYGIVTMEKNADVAAQADMLVLAVKPQFFEEVIHEIKDATRPETLIISIAAGKSIQWIEDAFARPVKLVRCMPDRKSVV